MKEEKELKRDLTGVGRRIVHAVIECVADKGFDATRIRDITNLAGTSEAAFYRFFTDLGQAVLYVIRHYYWERLNQRVVAYQHVQHDPIALLEGIINELFISHADNPNTDEDESKVFRIVVSEIQSPELGGVILSDPEYRRFIDSCAEILGHAQEEKMLSNKLSAEFSAELLAPFIHTILLLRRSPEIENPSDEEVKQAVWQLLGRDSVNI